MTKSPSDRAGHPWRKPWSPSPAAAGPRPHPWGEALERAIFRMYASGNSVERIAAALGLPEDRIREILREQEARQCPGD